jgi:hypothetical protein
MQARLNAQMSQHRKPRRDAMMARWNAQISQHSKLVWAVFGLCCVLFFGYALHRGIYIGKHMDYQLDARDECDEGTCRKAPGYQLYCTYWAVHGTFTESGAVAFPTYDEAAEHSYCRMFRI